MSATPHLRAATDADAEAAVALLTSLSLEAEFVANEFVVAEQAGRLVGTARLKPLPTGAHELASVAVLPDLQHSGLGRVLVAAALQRATGPVYALALAPRFFAKQGFAPLQDVPAELEAKATSTCAASGFTPMRWAPSGAVVVDAVRRHYGGIAVQAVEAAEACATDASCCGRDEVLPYGSEELEALPHGAYLALGSGNPVREANVRPGETVVDFGSGAGIDVFLASRAVGRGGQAIGIDFTPQMVERARRLADEGDYTNVRFLQAPMEHVPLPDAVADVVTSNCVINLSVDKAAVLREAFRVLKPGGRFVVSDTLRVRHEVPAGMPSCDCTAGALSHEEWPRLLGAAGFADAAVRVTDDGAGKAVGAAIVTARKP